jgi:predicted RNase H-like nuclease (RuvC/YqgF family)
MSNDRQFQEMPGQALINMQEAALRTLEMERDLLRTSLRERDKRIAKLEAENAELKLDVELKASIARTAIANFEQAEREIERLSAPVTDAECDAMAKSMTMIAVHPQLRKAINALLAARKESK